MALACICVAVWVVLLLDRLIGPTRGSLQGIYPYVPSRRVLWRGIEVRVPLRCLGCVARLGRSRHR